MPITSNPAYSISRTPALSPTTGAGSPLLNGLVAFWGMDELSGNRADLTGNGHTASDNNTVTSETGPNNGGNAAVFLDANDEYLSVTHDAAFNFTDGFTVAGWFAPDLEARSFMIGKYGSSASTRSWILNLDGTNQVEFIIYDEDENQTQFQHNASLPLDGTWHFIAFGLRDGNLFIQVDDDLDTQAHGGDEVNQTTTNIHIGGSAQVGGHYDGEATRIGIWDYGLTNGSLNQLRNGGVPLSYPFSGPHRVTLFAGQSNANKLFGDYSGAGRNKYAETVGPNYSRITNINGATDGAAAHKDADTGPGYYWDTDTDAKGPAYTTLDTAVSNSGVNSSDVDLIFWLQGEKDADKIDDATITKAEFKSATESIFDQLAADYPNAQIVLVPLGFDTNDTTNDGWFEARQAHYEITTNGTSAGTTVYEGPALFNLTHSDDLHYDQAGYEGIGLRLARRGLYLDGKISNTGLGPRITASSFAGGGTTETVTIAHSHGSNLSGTDRVGWPIFDDGTRLSISSVAVASATTLTTTHGSTIVSGSVVERNWPWGCGDNATIANVIEDNQSIPMAIQPIFGLNSTET